VLFRKWRTQRQLKEFIQTADPQAVAEERAALARENAEAPDVGKNPLVPTDVGAEMISASRRFENGGLRGIPAINRTAPQFRTFDVNTLGEKAEEDHQQD